ncbi:hypothetical protein [Nocardia gipuzkoensis]
MQLPATGGMDERSEITFNVTGRPIMLPTPEPTKFGQILVSFRNVKAPE